MTWRLEFELEPGEELVLRALGSRLMHGGPVEGELCLTSKRLVFSSPGKAGSFSLRREEVTSVTDAGVLAGLFGGLLPWMRAIRVHTDTGEVYTLKSFLVRRFASALNGGVRAATPPP
jgi:hypothetical protein